jgi:hypothetical protein
MSFSATDAAFEGFRVVRRHPITALSWGLVYLVMFLVVFGLGAGQLASIMAAAEAVEQSANPTPEELVALGQTYMGLLVWMAPLGLATGAVLSAAVARSVLRPAESAWGYLRLSMDEVRVLAVTLAIALIVGLASSLVFTVVGVVFGLGSSSGQALVILLSLVLGLGAVALVVWLSVKFCLSVPMTIDRRKIVLFESFNATKGRFWSLLGMAIIALIMSFVVSILGTIISAGTDLATGGIARLSALDGLSTIEILAQAWPAILVWSVVNAVLSALQLAVLYAPFSAAWQGLRNS